MRIKREFRLKWAEWCNIYPSFSGTWPHRGSGHRETCRRGTACQTQPSWIIKLNLTLISNLCFCSVYRERSYNCVCVCESKLSVHKCGKIEIDSSPNRPWPTRNREAPGHPATYLCFGSVGILLNPDPAKNLNPDPEGLESGSGSKLFLNTIGKKLKLLHNYQIFSSKEVNWKIECCKRH